MSARQILQRSVGLILIALLFISGQVHAEDGQGTLKVTTDKGSATVYLGFNELGKAPLRESIEAGTYTVRILKDGFEPYVRKIHIRPKQTTTMTARLYKGKGSVEILVEPMGAELKLNKSKETFTTPVRLKDLKVGTYAYTISAEGRGQERSLHLPARQEPTDYRRTSELGRTGLGDLKADGRDGTARWS